MDTPRSIDQGHPREPHRRGIMGRASERLAALSVTSGIGIWTAPLPPHPDLLVAEAQEQPF